jgi:hypothetical protein
VTILKLRSYPFTILEADTLIAGARLSYQVRGFRSAFPASALGQPHRATRVQFHPVVNMKDIELDYQSRRSAERFVFPEIEDR